MTVQARLRAAMQDAGISTAEMAAALHVTRGRVSQMLNDDETEIKHRQLIAICETLGISADEVLGLNTRDPRETELLKIFRRINNDAKEALCTLMRNMK